MAYDITAIDGAVIFEDSNGVQTLPNNQYRANFIQGSSTKIDILASDNQQANKITALLDASDVNSITDNRTGGQGVIAPVPGTLREIYDIIFPFFFRKPVANGGGLEPWLTKLGGKTAGASDIGTSFDYNDVTSQVMSSDGVMKVHQNYFKGVADASGLWGADLPNDYATTIEDDIYNDGLGIYPVNIKYQASQKSGGVTVYREHGSWVYSDNTLTHGAESFIWTDEESAVANVDTGHYVGVYGEDGAGEEYSSYISQDSANTTTTRTGVDALGSNVSLFYLLDSDDGRSGLTRIEDDGVESLSQDFAFYGTASAFGKRISRFLHEAPNGLLRRLYFEDDVVELRRDVNAVGDGLVRLNLTDTGHEIKGDLSLVNEENAVGVGGINNNFTTPNLQLSSVLHVNTTSNTTITGIVAPNTSRSKTLIVTNTGISNMTLSNNSGLSIAANRILLSGNELINPNESAILRYDTGSSRWRCISIYQ